MVFLPFTIFLIILVFLVLEMFIPTYKNHQKATAGTINYDLTMRKFVYKVNLSGDDIIHKLTTKILVTIWFALFLLIALSCFFRRKALNGNTIFTFRNVPVFPYSDWNKPPWSVCKVIFPTNSIRLWFTNCKQN